MRSARRHASEHKGPKIEVAGSVQSDINVTPLVDVCLVLLIIFMVVTPLLQSGIPILLPETNKPEKYPEGQKQVKVAIQEDGKIFIGQDWVPTRAELTKRMEDMLAADPQKEVVIKADRRLKYRDVREVMKALNDAGFTKVGLITTKKGAM
ncbi:MAG TPA: biopolymer transporter ExbD [Thermoanaerobaculaceae bacterium]|nr:biopolymer transporter ExbD [Thermoanaerobaculaceae bacterium]